MWLSKEKARDLLTALAVLSGSALAYRLALAPNHWFFLTPFIVAPLVFYAATIKTKTGFILFSSSAGIAAATLVAAWVPAAMIDYAETDPLLAWFFLVVVTGGYIGIFYTLALAGCIALVQQKIRSESFKDRLFAYLVATAVWTLAEYIRSRFPISVPWALAGYGYTGSDLLSQVVDSAGIYGLTFLAVLTGLLVADGGRVLRQECGPLNKQWLWGPAVALGIISLQLLYGLWSGPTPEDDRPAGGGQKWAIVQANIDQSRRWQPGYYDEQTARYLKLSEQAVAEGAQVLVWAETSIQWYLQDGLRDGLTAFFEAYPEVYLITGAPRYERRPGKKKPDLFNSVFLLQEGRIKSWYDKVELLPFGEYFPWRGIDFIANRFASPTEYSFGRGPVIFDLGPVKAAPMICYESVFSSLLRDNVALAPNVVVNLTNDAWFGTSAGPYQHLDFARLTARALGQSIVRSANTGISGLVTAGGEIRHTLGLKETGISTFTVGDAVGGSLYASWGDWIIAVCLLIIGTAIVIRLKKSKRA